MPATTWQEAPTDADPTEVLPDARTSDRAPHRLRVVLTRYLALAVVLLGIVLILDPYDPGRTAPDARPWDYQRESLDLEGRGVLNAYSRGTMRATAWLARGSIERIRDLNRLNLIDYLIGEPSAQRLADWRSDHGRTLELTTRMAVLALVGYGVIMRPARRTWVLWLLLLLVATVVVTKPSTTVELASTPSVGIPNAALAVFSRMDPGQPTGGDRGNDAAAEVLATQYWDGFVGYPMSRLQSGSDVLASAEPEDKAGVLASLRRNISSVNDWALGHRGVERAFVSTLALLYALPFAAAVGVAAMVGTSAQAMLFLLALAGLIAVPLAADRRRRPAVVSLWLLPLLGTAAVLAVGSLSALVVMRVAASIHAVDEYVGMLLAGSLWPLLTIALLRRRAVRRRRSRLAASPPDLPETQGAS